MSELLRVEQLRKHFSLGEGLQRVLLRERRMLRAVDGVSFAIQKRETFGLAGESGCGKTTLARLVCLLEYPTDGRIWFLGEDVSWMRDRNGIRDFYKNVQMVFQDPLASLNPRKSVQQILEKPLLIQEGLGRRESRRRILQLLEDVDLTPSEEYLRRYPHELSGGEKQRVVIARAVALRPRLVVADEPVASLDMSIRGKILNLMSRLQLKYGISYLLITHDLRVLRVMSRRIAIMYLGKVVELAGAEALFASPHHPYTLGLISAELIPDPDSRRTTRGAIIEGEVPSPIDPPSGCRFHTRCKYRKDRCCIEEPRLMEAADRHWVACHYWREVAGEQAGSAE